MLNIFFDYNNKVFSYIQHRDYGEITDIQELITILSQSLAMFSFYSENNTEKEYDNYIEKLIKIGTSENMEEYLEEILIINEDQIFINEETKEQAVRHIAYTLKSEIDEFVEEYAKEYELEVDETKKALINNFIEDMKDIYNVDISDILNNKSIDDYEDILL